MYAGPRVPDAVLAAIAAGGGVVVDRPDDARAVVWTGHDPAALLELLHDQVTWVQLRHAGIERWIAAGAIDDTRTWTSARGVFGRVVAERATALLLGGVHRLGEHAAHRTWRKLPTASLVGRTVLVIGTGAIGEHVALGVAALGAVPVGVNRNGAAHPAFARTWSVDAWPAPCAEADHLVVAAPLTDRTRGLVDRAALARLPEHAVVVNVARGEIVVTDALVEALGADRIAGAGLDVTAPEPLPADHPLWHDDRVTITSHTANPSSEGIAVLADRVRENVERWRTGRPLLGRVDVARGY